MDGTGRQQSSRNDPARYRSPIRITDPHGEFLILAGNTDMHQSFNQRVHFYYCVLVALKMHGKSKKAGGIRGKNNFLLKWLRRAQDNNIFLPISPVKSNGCEEKLFRLAMTPISSRCWILSTPPPAAPRRSKTPNRLLRPPRAQRRSLPCLNPRFGQQRRRNPATFYFVTLSRTKVTAEVH